MRTYGWYLINIGFFLMLFSCGTESTIPKPYGYPRFEPPVAKKIIFSEKKCPFTFLYGDFMEIKFVKTEEKECWFNLHSNLHNSDIHFTFKKIQKNYDSLTEDSRKLVLKHLKKAVDIKNVIYTDSSKMLFALLFDLSGQVASPIQFHASDTKEYFVRGSLYFNLRPNYDSLKPVIGFYKAQIAEMIESLEWIH